MVINHLLTGMILQVVVANEGLGWDPPTKNVNTLVVTIITGKGGNPSDSNMFLIFLFRLFFSSAKKKITNQATIDVGKL